MKTIGEAAVDYGNQITLKSTDNIGARHIAWRSFEAGVEFAQQVEWRKINGYDGFYEISNIGEIKSISRESKNNKNKRTIFISKSSGTNGYLHAGLTDINGIRKNHDVHRLVALAFIDNPANLEQVNHIDGNKFNNSYLNLEWVSRSDNMKHAYKLGLQTPTKYWEGKHGEDHASSRAVRCIDDDLVFVSIKEAADFYKTQRCSVSLVCRGKLKTTANKKFSFI